MSYPGLSYPSDNNYLTRVKDRGYFILVDRDADNISLLPGGEINELLAANNNLLFVFGKNIAGSKQDIIDALYLAGLEIVDINNIVDYGISVANINTPESQQWISILKKQNNGETTISAVVYQPDVNRETLPNLSYPVRSQYSQEYISYNRKLTHDTITQNYLGGNPNFEAVPNILPILFSYYDQLFFGHRLTQIMAKDNIQLSFEFGAKLTKTGGYCDRKGCVFIIKLSEPIILGTFRKGEKSHNSNGLQCYNRLDCLINVFEHELIHFVIGITHGHIKDDAVYKSHGLLFQQLAKAYFGHTDFKHSLLGNVEKPGKREDFVLGNIVTYQSNIGETVTDVILKLNPKRAVVGTMSVPYPLLRLATPDEAAMYKLIAQMDAITVSPQAITTQQTFKVGDIVAIDSKKGTITGRLIKINPSTYDIGDRRVSHQLVRHATQPEIDLFLQAPQAHTVGKTRADFYQGQIVQFTDSRTGKIVTGPIRKLNPARAVIEGYTVPYAMLRYI